jgi:hypothetical protein
MEVFIFNTLSIQEYLAVKHGIKPVMRQGIDAKDLETLRQKVESENLSLLTKTLDISRRINQKQKMTDKILVAYISKSMKLAKQTHKAEMGQDDKRFGELLGYPECCVSFYQDKIPHPTDDKFSFTLHTLSNTKGKPSFFTNNIFNFQTKVGTKHKLDTFNVYKNLLGDRLNHFLISHIPCSYRCKESIGLGKERLKILEEEYKEFTKRLVSDIRKTFLVMDDFNWVSFDGKADGNSIRYRKAEPFLASHDGNKFVRGNRVVIEGKEIEILKDEKLLHKISNLSNGPKVADFS